MIHAADESMYVAKKAGGTSSLTARRNHSYLKNSWRGVLNIRSCQAARPRCLPFRHVGVMLVALFGQRSARSTLEDTFSQVR
jgi:hypothetical protein